MFLDARSADDEALRERMRNDLLRGSISTSFRREPCYFHGCTVQGDIPRVIKCIDTTTNEVVALGARTVFDAYINGQAARLGYLCDLRSAEHVRSGTLLSRGFKYLKTIHNEAPVALYYTMILSDNKAATSALTGHRAGLPHYQPCGQCFTPTIHLDVARRHPFDCSLRIVTGNDVPLGALVDFINQQNRRYQFAPVLSVETLQSARFRGLYLSDIVVACRGDSIVGCVACWDQSTFKQIHVEHYSRGLRLVRPFYNGLSRLSALKPLPSVGEQLRFFYLSLIAIEADNRAVFRDLLEYVYAQKRQSNYHFFMAGLHEQHPLVSELQRFRHIPIHGNLYIVHWEDGQTAFNQLDGRPPHIDIATL